MKLYIIPPLNLPTKSHQTVPPPERNPPRIREPLPPPKESSCYNDFDDFIKRIGKLKISPWTFRLREEKRIYIKLLETGHILPLIQIRVNETLDISIFVYNWSLPKNHFIYQQHGALNKIFLSDFLRFHFFVNFFDG